MIFEESSFSRYILAINWTDLMVWLPLLLEISGNMCIYNLFCTSFWRHKFEIYQAKNLPYNQKSQDKKFKYLKNQKRF